VLGEQRQCCNCYYCYFSYAEANAVLFGTIEQERTLKLV
jgi:hypothetical protein